MQTANETIINVQEIEPRLRHQTIFQVFRSLKEGESFIIHNNHDPQPVYYQLLELYGEVFAWEYLQKGPDWWDIRVTKDVELEDNEEIIVNVPAIAPQHKHATIFNTYENLRPGASFIIHNNHDPKPVYYQLSDMHGDTFVWEYLQEGPEWWDIRVTKKDENTASNNANGGKQEVVINVPAIHDHMLKHATIFKVFTDTKPGESFVIHNDHDPLPLYHQLMNMHGDIFTWTYLQKGPVWYDIRVAKKPTETAKSDETPAAKGNEKVVDVPSLEPKLKHPTIFKVFDSLQAGESMIIHNDHDPKPVYYQLQAEKGDVFTWEYLQQGPQWWDIRVTRKGTEIKETIGEIVSKDLRKADILKKYGIDFCCGGKKTVREACAELGIDAGKVEAELQKPATTTSGGTTLNYNDWNVDFLADYIVNTHHSYSRKYLPEIRGYAAKVAQVHGGRHPELLQIRDLVEQVNAEMIDHMAGEEAELFPIIKEIVKAKNTNGAYTRKEGKTFEALVAATEKEHDSVGDAMKGIRSLSKNFALPDDACTSYKLLFKMLEEFETDLFTHIHLENNMLFPKAIEQEKTLG